MSSVDLHRLAMPVPNYGGLTEDAYPAMGLRVGLEIHQQLLTDRKLFCRCPAGHYSCKHDAEILRHMRPTLSEMGEYDGTALMEFKTKKNIIYQLCSDTVCTYEMDDAPPFELDPVALDHAIAISRLLGLQLVGEVHIARKQYLDGSIPTGFQRTALIGVRGKIPFRGRDIEIRQLGLEEDSCREASDKAHTRIYRTDRLGMPLIETVTGPDMHTPEEAAAVAQILRALVRLTGRVRTGAGAARQDVNVSVEGGTRVEIKGVSSIRSIPALIHAEAMRQRRLITFAEVLRERDVDPDDLETAGLCVTDLLKDTTNEILQSALSNGAQIQAVPLKGFNELLESQIEPHTAFLKDFSDRVRVIACIDTQPNLLCSTTPGNGVSSAHWSKIAKDLGVSDETPILLTFGSADDVKTATNEIVIRAKEALYGVPSETRQALEDNTTGFERILPGPERMYPDTDLPPIPLDPKRVARVTANLPLPPWTRYEKLLDLGVTEDLAARLARSLKSDDLFTLCSAFPSLDATRLASTILERPLCSEWSLETLKHELGRVSKGQAFFETLWAGLTEDLARPPLTNVASVIPSILDDVPEPKSKDDLSRERYFLGAVMRELRGQIEGSIAIAYVKAWLRLHPATVEDEQ